MLIMKKILSSAFVFLILIVSLPTYAQNTSYGVNAGGGGRYNVSVGEGAGDIHSIGANYNTSIGYHAGKVQKRGTNNVFIGSGTGKSNNNGSKNVYLGSNAGLVNNGYGNVLIGYNAGAQLTGNNQLYIDNSNTTSPLIWGDFSSNKVKIHGEFQVNGNINFNNRTLIVNGSGANTDHIWYDDASAYGALGTWHFVADRASKSNGNARIQGGNIYMSLQDGTNYIGGMLGIGTTSPSEKLDVNGALRVRSLIENSSLTRVLVADANGKFFYRDASSFGGGNQSLSLSGNLLTISGGNSVNLGSINTQLSESEVDAFVSNNGYLTSFTEIDGDITNEIQDLQLSGNILSITNNLSATSIDLSQYLDDTNTQLSESEVDAFVSNNGYLTSFTEIDGDITNEIQDLQLSGNILSITNNLSATSIDLSQYLDDTNTQLSESEVDAFVSNNGYLTSFTEIDGDITNEIQDLQLSGNILSITNNLSATSIDLSQYLDDTNTQLTESEVDAFVSNNGYLTSFTELDGDVTNEIQDASQVDYDNSTSGLNATNTQNAIDELSQGTFWKPELAEGINYEGKVGINLSTATNDIPANYHLAVNGNIIAEEVNIQIEEEWPDYVFEETYHLHSLKETEKYIERNKHLPNVPSAKDVDQNGIDLGTMNAVLLRKIEELTLHLIDQNKKIEELSAQVSDLTKNQ